MTVAVTAVFMALPMLWCWAKSGQFRLTDSMGFHLFNRVVTEQKLLDEKGLVTKTLLSLLEGKDPRGLPHWEIREHGKLQKVDYLEAEFLLRTASIEAIRKYPWDFLVFTPRLAWRVLRADSSYSIPRWGDTIDAYPGLESPPPLAFTAGGLDWRLTLEEVNKILWPVLCWAAIGGTLIGLFLPQRNLILALVLVPTGYLLGSACVEYFHPRYNVAVMPFIVALSMVPFALIQRVQKSKTG